MPFITKRGYLLLIPYIFYLIYNAYVNQKKDSQHSFNINYLLMSLFLSVSAFLLSDWLGNEIKNLVNRPRPCNILEDVRLLVGCSSSYSLPSNHATNSTAVAFSLFYLNHRYINRLISFYPIILAFLILYSRVYVGVHYPSDVIAGAILGIALSFLLIKAFRLLSIPFKKNPYKTILFSFLLILSVFRIYYISHGPIDLSPDEAHYWEWSRRLDLSYYSKGPMIAYLIYLGTSLFGHTVFGIRIMAVLFSALSSIFLFRLVNSLYKDTKPYPYNSIIALFSAILLQIIPLFSPFGVIFTIDSPFIFFWILSLYFFHRTLESEGKKNWKINWIFLGLSIGLGLLTKYTMVFFFLCAFLFLLFSEKRYLLKTKLPYLSTIVSLIIFSPVILWNYKHEWLTVKHTAGQAHVSAGITISLNSFIEFIGSQIAVITPVIFFMMIYALIKIQDQKTNKYFLSSFSVPVLLFFILKSLHAKVQANWAMSGYITAIIAFCVLYLKTEQKNNKKFLSLFKNKRLVIVAISISLLVTAIAHYPSILGLPSKLDPSSRLKGWKALGFEVSTIYKELLDRGPVLIFSDRYQVSSELAFYVSGHPKTFCINNGRRMNQYDLWPDINQEAKRLRRLNKDITINAIYVRTGDTTMPQKVNEAFDKYEKRLLRVFDRNKRLIREYSIFICYNFKGLKIEIPDKF
jgi:undecaprenyl-diphosphatase